MPLLLNFCLELTPHSLRQRPHDKDFFIIIKMVTDMPSKTLQPVSLAESLLRDLFGRGPETEPVVFQTLLGNMQSYLEIVTHQNFSKELMNCTPPSVVH